MIIIKHILRNIINNKSKSILLIFALFLSTIVLFFNLTINDDLIFKYDEMRRGIFKEYDLRLIKEDGSFSKDELNFNNLTNYEILYFKSTGGIYSKDEEISKFTLLGTDLKLIQKSLAILNKELDNVNWDNKDNVIIGQNLAESYGFKIGDKIKLYTSIGEIEVLISGIAENEGIMKSTDANSLFIVTEALCNEIDGKGYMQAYINLDEKVDVEEVLNILKEDNPLFKISYLNNIEEAKASIGVISQLLFIILLVIIMLNYYVISSLTERILAERLPVMGTFRSIGASKNKVSRILILENVVYGVIGGVIGIIIGSLLRSPLSNLFSQLPLNYNEKKLPVNVSYIIIAFSFAIILQVFISSIVISKTNKNEIKDIIFNTIQSEVVYYPTKGIIGIIQFILSIIINMINYRYNLILGALSFILMIFSVMLMLPYLIKGLSKELTYLFGPSSKLGIKNLANNRLLFSSIRLITISLSLIIVIYMAILSLDNFFTRVTNEYEHDIQISQIKYTEEHYQKLNNIEGIDNITFNYYNFEYTLNSKGVVIVGRNKSNVDIKGVETLFSNLRDDETLIDEHYAIKNNLKKGDIITFVGHKQELKFIIKGYVDSSLFSTSANVFVINQKTYIEKITNIPSEILITTKEIIEVKDALMRELVDENVQILTIEELITSQQQYVDSILGLIQGLMLLSIILASLGIINNQLISFMQRKKELAILYSVAMNKSQLRKMIFLESIGTFLIGCILGGWLGVMLLPILETCTKSIGIVYTMKIDFSALFSTLGLIFFILMLTSISPILKVGKIDIVQEIKYE